MIMSNLSRRDSVSYYYWPGLKKIGTFVETSMPVVDYYRQHGKVVEVSSLNPCMCELMKQVDSSPSVEVVYQNVRAAINPRLPSASHSGLGHIPLDSATAAHTSSAAI